MGNLFGIDFGTRRIGIARSDRDIQLAFPYKTLLTPRSIDGVADIILANIHDVEKIVIGLPLHLSGRDGEMSTLARQLANGVRSRCEYEVILWDERLTSKEAKNLFRSQSISSKEYRLRIDETCAAMILQSYIDCMRNTK